MIYHQMAKKQKMVGKSHLLYQSLLVGGLEPWNFDRLSHHIGNVIIPTDELHSMIFQRGRFNHQPELSYTYH